MAESIKTTGRRTERIQSVESGHGNPIAASLEELCRGTNYTILSAVGGCLVIAQRGTDLGDHKNHTTMSVADFRNLSRTPEAIAA